MQPLDRTMSQILEAYQRAGQNKTKAAELLGMSRSAYRRAFDKEGKKIPYQSDDGPVLVIGDCHAPCMHKDYIPFLKKMQKKHGCKRVVHIGDLVDWSAISYHEKDPRMPGLKEEFEAAWKQVRELHAAFPEVDFLVGNHDALPYRKAQTIGLSEDMLRSFEDFWALEGWTIHPRFHDLIIDGVVYRHGDKCKGGQMAAHKNSVAEFRSLVQGHLHAQAGIVYHANQDACVFGMQVGCGCDHKHPAMNYGRVYAAKPIVGCGVVYSSRLAFFEPAFL